MHNFIVKAVVLIAALAACPATLLQADIIYSNLGSGFDPGAGDVVSSSTNSSDQRPSVEFSPGVNEALISVDFVTSIDAASDPNDITVSLYGDAGGHPGALIASQEFMGAMGISGNVDNPPGIISWDPLTELDLVAGTQYWITLDGPTDSDITWNYNQEGAFGYTRFKSGSWESTGNTLGAIDIVGGTFGSSPSTPEPGSALLLGLGLIAVIGTIRHRASSRHRELQCPFSKAAITQIT